MCGDALAEVPQVVDGVAFSHTLRAEAQLVLARITDGKLAASAEVRAICLAMEIAFVIHRVPHQSTVFIDHVGASLTYA
jgi:hypothetical protein